MLNSPIFMTFAFINDISIKMVENIAVAEIRNIVVNDLIFEFILFTVTVK